MGSVSKGVALVTVVHGDAYKAYADDLYESAREFFMRDRGWDFIVLPGRPGWPDATLYRYHVVRENWQQARLGSFTHMFLSDADMRFEGPVGAEILGQWGLAATLHPGYVGKPRAEFPYETRPQSSSRIKPEDGSLYFCGGFIGGRTHAFKQLCNRILYRIDMDREKHELVPVWHDESVLNRVLSIYPPELVLSPAYCHPDHDDYYKTFWPEDYPRLLVALDKAAAEREGR